MACVQVGLTSPGHIGADVCHLNLHKTFCIPHGGGGPGMGPIGVKVSSPHLQTHAVSMLTLSHRVCPPTPLSSAENIHLLVSWARYHMIGLIA